MKERNCRVKACTGQCAGCKRIRRERRAAQFSRDVIEMCREKGILPEIAVEARGLAGVAMADLQVSAALPSVSEIVEWF